MKLVVALFILLLALLVYMNIFAIERFEDLDIKTYTADQEQQMKKAKDLLENYQSLLREIEGNNQFMRTRA